MSHRARALLGLGLLGLLLGTVRSQAILSLVSFAILLWVIVQWMLFHSAVRMTLHRMRLRRTVNGQAGASGTLWAGRKVEIALLAEFPIPPIFALDMHDVIPEMLELSPQEPPQAKEDSHRRRRSRVSRFQARWSAWTRKAADFLSNLLIPKSPNYPPNSMRYPTGEATAELHYRAGVRAAGRLTLPGVRLTIQDHYGLFRIDRFSMLPQRFRVLPNYHQSGELTPSVKRQNSLPRQGIHRLQRAGMGSELLELRDYVAGDPPKSIAWKVSARRDKLLTRQYESEVPVRVHLIIDGALPTRIGGFGFRLIDQINYVAASVAKAAVSVGDPIGGALVDDSGVRRLPWMTGDRGFLDFLKTLSDFSVTALPEMHVVNPALLQCALSVCHQRYPELLDKRFNFFRFRFGASARKRCRIAAVLSEVLSLTPQEQLDCIYDDASLARYLRLFLWHEGMAWMHPIVPPVVEPPTVITQRAQRICDLMQRSVVHARDNELFVVMADLLSHQSNLPLFTRSIRMARARHHRVAFVCPTTTFARPTKEVAYANSDDIGELLLAAEQARVRELALIMKRSLVQAGATITFSGEQQAIDMVISEMEMARDGRSRPLGARR